MFSTVLTVFYQQILPVVEYLSTNMELFKEFINASQFDNTTFKINMQEKDPVSIASTYSMNLMNVFICLIICFFHALHRTKSFDDRSNGLVWRNFQFYFLIQCYRQKVKPKASLVAGKKSGCWRSSMQECKDRTFKVKNYHS